MTAALALLADFGSDGHMDWDNGWWILMAVGMVLFWGVVIFAVVWGARELGSSRKTERSSQPDAMATLDNRLAAGEISPEEYRERRAVLRDEPSPSSDT